MRFAKRLVLLVFLTVMLLPPASPRAETSVVLDHVDGLAFNGAIRAGEPITMYFSFVSDVEGVQCATLGHRLYSPDGATWSVPVIEAAAPNLAMYWDLGVFTNQFGCDGVSPDTLSFSGIKLFQSGLPFGFSAPVYKISFEVDVSQVGKTICVDSSWFPPGGIWDWLLGSGDIAPDWGGPYCFEIVPCCYDQTGDANLDGSVNVGDISYLVEYLFQGGPLVCEGTASVDGRLSGSLVNVADLTHFVGFMFQGGPPLAPCQQ